MPSRANREFGWMTRRTGCGEREETKRPLTGASSLGFPDTLARRRRRAFAEEVGTELRPGPPTDDDDDPHEPDEHPRSSAVFRTAQARPRSSSRWAPMSRLG